MTMFAALSLIALAAAAPVDQRRDGLAATQARREGVMKIREVERRIIPTMGDAQYLGFDLEMPSGVYTLKFLRDGNVIWVEVDGRSGQVIGRSGR
ncbi:hypothetical protein M0208_16155 [Sphingomonas sp. SUN019]|uniref:hypothetical protein n=1 Tax=Sphingomonas sp. SUN019 TaxID=2937788 RepID=UPI002164E460|nr:hypothetical protein [Sphingomonas sp. SUN019]UVO51968.1 hypothetical protein M0208_16155 [Sphingomonas sp. SUN019]